MVRGTFVKSKGRHPDSIRFSKSASESPRASYLPVISNSVFSQAIKPSGHLITNSFRWPSRFLLTSRITCVTNTDTNSPTLTQNHELLNEVLKNHQVTIAEIQDEHEKIEEFNNPILNRILNSKYLHYFSLYYNSNRQIKLREGEYNLCDLEIPQDKSFVITRDNYNEETMIDIYIKQKALSARTGL